MIPPQNIILGGLSQGCAMALFVLLSLDFPVSSFFGLSGWLPFRDDIMELINDDGPGSGTEVGEVVIFGEDGDNDGKDDSPPPIQALNLVRDILSMDKIDSRDTIDGYNYPNLATPVFLGHGREDAKVNCGLGEDAATALQTLGMEVTWRCYPELGHWYKIPDEIDEIVEFITGKMAT